MGWNRGGLVLHRRQGRKHRVFDTVSTFPHVSFFLSLPTRGHISSQLLNMFLSVAYTRPFCIVATEVLNTYVRAFTDPSLKDVRTCLLHLDSQLYVLYGGRYEVVNLEKAYSSLR